MVPMATLWHVYKIKVPDDSIESLNLTYVSALHSASYRGLSNLCGSVWPNAGATVRKIALTCHPDKAGQFHCVKSATLLVYVSFSH